VSLLRRFGPRALSATDRASLTAEAVTLWRALELRRPATERIITDQFAPVFLGATGRALLGPLAAATPVRDRIARHDLGGLSTYVLCRHRFIDEQLLQALRAGAEQVLVLGAGYDARAYRFAAELDRRPVYEVDLPPASQRKAAIIAAHERVFADGSVHRVEIDFAREHLPGRLDSAGFVRARKTFVIWEGVAPYLDAATVDATLDAVRAVCGPGSTIALDLWDGTGGPGRLAPVRRLAAQALALVGEPVRFGVLPAAATMLLHEHGFEVSEQAGAPELTARYATAGRRSAESLYVLAARR
jgi:methyltransferase (TIGR00027 family)